jgi:hypothetical protein
LFGHSSHFHSLLSLPESAGTVWLISRHRRNGAAGFVPSHLGMLVQERLNLQAEIVRRVVLSR